jgi:hypothetical protein
VFRERPIWTGLIAILFCGALVWALVRPGTGRHNDGTGIPLRDTPDLPELVDTTIEFEAELLGEAKMFLGAPIPGKTAYWMRLSPFRKVIVFAEPGLSCAGVVEARGKVIRRESQSSAPARRGGGTTMVDHQIDADRLHCRS